jgi:HlyD family secretion protein
MKRSRLSLGIAVGLAATAAGLYVGFTRDRSSGERELLLSGNIEAHESVIAFKTVQSRIVELPFDEGQWVDAGTLLARVDASDYEQQVTIADAALRARRAELASAKKAFEAARSAVRASAAEHVQRKRDSQRVGTLWRKGIVAKEQQDRVETALEQSDAVLQRDRALAAVRARDIEVAEATVRTAHEQLRLSRLLLDYTILRAPFAGVILVRQAELGEVTLPGTPVVTLADLDHVWLRAYVRETDLGRIHWGQTATIRTDSYRDRRYKGRISFISSQAEFTPKSVETHAERVTLVYRIRIDVDNEAHELKPGMPADATIDIGSTGANG